MNTHNQTMARTKTTVIITLTVLFALSIVMVIVFRNPIRHFIALHKGKSAIAHHIVTPVDLDDAITHHGLPASYFAHSDNDPAWWSMPKGFQDYDNVPFQINGAIFLWGAGPSIKRHLNFPEQIPGILVNQKFQTLYLLHCAFYASKRGTPVYQVIFHYEGDSVSPVTNVVHYDADILGWYADKSKPRIGPRGPHSRLAWVGGTVSATNDNPLRLCLTAITNPLPDQVVTTIDLASCKNESATCLVGMTTGQSGLLK